MQELSADTSAYKVLTGAYHELEQSLEESEAKVKELEGKKKELEEENSRLVAEDEYMKVSMITRSHVKCHNYPSFAQTGEIDPARQNLGECQG